MKIEFNEVKKIVLRAVNPKFSLTLHLSITKSDEFTALLGLMRQLKQGLQ